MHASIRTCLSLALLALAACSPTPTPLADASSAAPATSVVPSPASIAVVQDDKEKCSNESRTDENDQRPRCGGMDVVAAGPAHAYRITLDNGEFFEACDITKPFTGGIGHGMVSLAFTPDDNDEKTGTVAWHFANGHGMADTAYAYELSGPADKMTGTFRAKAAVCGKAAGLGGCAAANKQVFSSIWTKIDACEDAA